MNPVAEALTGWSSGEAAGLPLRSVFRIVDEASGLEVENPVEKVLATGTVVGLANHTVLIARDGTERPIDDSAASIKDDRGETTGVVLVFRDITERRRAEARLRESEERFAFVRQASGVGFWYCDLPFDVLEWDDRVKAHFHLASDDRVTIGTFYDRIHPDDRAATRAAIGRSIAERSHYNTDYRTVAPGGGAEKWVQAIGRTAYAPDGTPTRFDGVTIDVTGRKRAEQALLEGEGRFRFLDALGQATRSASDPGEIMAASARLLGEHLAVARGAYADVEADGDRITIRHDWTAPGGVSIAGVYSLGPFGPRAGADLRGGRTLIIRDVEAEVAEDEGAGAFRSLGIGAVLCCPLVKRGRLAALMGVHHDGPRDWTPAEVALVEAVAERSWAHVERARDSAALREKDERLKLLVENVKDYAVIISDPAGTVVEWQGGAERITGYAPAEVVGRRADLLFSTEDRAGGRAAREMEEAARAGRAENKRWHLKKDGTRFFADGVMTALRDDDGKLRGFGKVFRDATWEWRAEEASRRRAFQFQKLADIANRINSAHDVGSVLGVVTREARDLLGAGRAMTTMVEDPRHPPAANVVSAGPGSHEAVIEAVHEANESPRADFEADPRWRTLGGPPGPGPTGNGRLSASLVGRDGKSMGIIQLSDKHEGEFTDDDEAVLLQLSQLAAIANARLYQELRSNDARKDEFLAMLAHELRNPLAAIGNAVKLTLLTSAAGAKEHVDWSMEIITRQMHHLTRLIDDLMDVSRITRGKIELRRELVEASPILESAAVTVATLVEERQHTLELAIDRGNLWIDADATRLEQMVVNLLNNAAKYSENAGHVRLTARLEGDEVVIAVKDRGLGIPPERLPEMFVLFSQGDRSLARSEGGLGIGLTVVKKLVEMHGGTVSASSEGPGLGSEFVIRLPAAKAPRDRPPEAPSPARPAARKARILVVDDNVDTVRGMARFLKLIGHEVATAYSGPEAIEVARERRPEFVLLDIGLPGLSGYEVASRLRNEECCASAVIVAVSGYGQDEDRRRSKEAGFDFHLTKPLDHDALLALLSAGVAGEGGPARQGLGSP